MCAISEVQKPAEASVDIARFKELSDGDPASLLELVNLYITKTSEQVQQLQKALAAKSQAEVGRIAHSMIGANLMVGMDVLVPTLRALEATAEKGDLAPAPPLVDDVSRIFGQIETTLKQAVH